LNLINNIEQFIENLRQLVQLNVIETWRDVTWLNKVNLDCDLAPIDLKKSLIESVNQKGYIVFAQGRKVKWLAQRIKIANSLKDYPLSGLSLRLVLTWWASDAQIFVNGELMQQGDLFDSSARVLLTDNVQPGQEYIVAIRLVSPNHDIGALMRSHLIYEKSDTSKNIDPGLIANEVTVMSKYLTQFEPEQLVNLANALNGFCWDNITNGEKFAEDLAKLRSRLLPLAKNIKQRSFNLLGHAHLDMAWLWTTDETYEVAERTFKSVLNLQQDFPALTFGHTSPALYEWIEENRPELFADIKDAVTADKWEILGGMWIEPETNLVSGESLIRQLLYGQEYYQSKFGEICKVAWLPDSFGFTWQLPQIYKQCGIEYFVTGKLHWNDSNKFPLGCFWWESPDGTRLLTLMSPPNVTGVMDTNPITMTNYAVDWEIQTGLQEIFWLPGVGDHGGGPTGDMLEVAQKWHSSPFFPEIKFSKSIDYLEKITAEDSALNNFPIWNDELYLELHRGCYTVHADQKKYNRYGERLLYEAELWSTLATILCPDSLDRHKQSAKLDTYDNPQQLIELAWKKVLFNQFHDILPGTSIPEVFLEANQDWESAIAIGENVLQNALIAIASGIKLPESPQTDAQPIVVFNSLNWTRSQQVTIEDERFAACDLAFGICDRQGQKVVSTTIQETSTLHFLAQDIPGVGYSLYWLCRQKFPVKQAQLNITEAAYQLENQYLKVFINPLTGNIDSIFDQQNKQEILSGAGNELQAFEDQGQYWDAWNIDPDYEQKQLSPTELESISWIESRISKGIRVVKRLNQSTFTQDYILECDSPILKICNRVDWQETHVMVKAAFPLKLQSDYVTYEIPCGTITRTTKPQTAEEKAKWEVSALNWADLTDQEQNYGVSLLNDCKYGYDAKPNQLRLTLLRSPTWPDPTSDRGIHHFTYAIYPHAGDWRSAHTVQKGYELNTPLQVIKIESEKLDPHSRNLAPSSQLLNLSAANLILMALKISAEQKLIMRFYEAYGKECTVNINSDLNLTIDTKIDALERDSQEQINGIVKPYKIVTYQLNN